jgi:hypothetical protein
LPNKADQELLDFLEEEAIIQGYDEGFQYLMRNNSHLHQMKDCFIETIGRKVWYKNRNNKMMMHKFKIFLEDEHFRTGKDKDGVYYFDIPLSKSSQDHP